MRNWLVLLGLAVLLASCASALKKQCEGTNWFQHGHNVAMSGKRLSADDFAKRCEDEGVHANAAEMDLGFKSGMQNYCKVETVYSTGKDGQFFSDDFCDPNEIRMLKKRHADGVREFCQSENGYTVGAAGRTYNNICPKDLEKPFLVRFKKGRKVYLGNEILKRERQIADLDNDVSMFERERSRKSLELSALNARPPRHEFVTKTNPDGSHSTELKAVTDPNIESEKQNLQRDIGSADRKIDQARAEQKKLRNETFDLKKEQNSLEE